MCDIEESGEDQGEAQKYTHKDEVHSGRYGKDG